ncbi:hypothetical protein PG994_014069 [Apiospora phragmitis]|uniref:Uncharacterized protein n=1 Tax=Apiospora phragmitis TaxID=2905665 RepID=A0ABR1T3P6_9PEZI
MIIHYPHSGVTTTYGWHTEPDAQWEAACDWIALNTTCRLLRSLGMDVWYRTRRFAMSSSLPQRLQQLNLRPGLPSPSSSQPKLSKMSQPLGLDRIEGVILVDCTPRSPAGLLGLPKWLTLFPKLRHCTLVYGHGCNGSYGKLQAAVTDSPSETAEGQHMEAGPPDLLDLLHDIGMPENIQIDIVVLVRREDPFTNVHKLMSDLRHNVYPMLRLKARALKRQAEAVASDKGS